MASRDRSNDRLLRLAAAGDAAALGELLAAHRRQLTRLAGARIGKQLQSKADPADVVQEALLEACRQFKNFRGRRDVEFAAWLRRILAGRIANHLRHFLGTRQRDARLEQILAIERGESSYWLQQHLTAGGCTPAEQVERQEMSATLTDAVRSLPDHYRRVILLRHVEDLSFTQVAARMDRSVDSVEKIWVRALSHLRKQLEQVA